ncbi:unnamed protein product [Colias eurytheme]|nr:unnamed protein product [Colias eurytheme]
MFLLIISVWIIIPVNSETFEAISYQSYNRYDVPLSYAFKSVHKHGVPKRNINNIQYAPLVLKPKDEIRDTDTDTVEDNYEVTNRYDNVRSKLEPQGSQERMNNKQQQIPAFVPGYNYQLKSPRVIEDERIYSENNYNDNNDPEHLLNYKKSETEQSGRTPLPLFGNSNNNFPVAVNVAQEIKHVPHNNQVYSNGNGNIRTLPTLENDNIQPYMLVKTPRLHLNVARAYRFIQGPHKALAKLNDFKLQNLSSQNKMSDRKTYLQPVPNKHVHLLHRVK